MTELLPYRSKIKLVNDAKRYSLHGIEIEPIKSGTIATVAQDFGGGRINVWWPEGGNLSEIIYLTQTTCVPMFHG